MKREILCRECNTKSVRGITEDSDPLAIAEAAAFGESVTRRYGVLRASAMCDGCDKTLEAGEDVVAMSVSTYAASYYEWEHEYVDLQS